MMTDPTPEGLNVVLGAGAIGLTIAGELVSRGAQVRVVNRAGNAELADGVEWHAADLADSEAARKATAGAAVVYHAVNPPYQNWLKLFPAIHTSIIGAAADTGARLVMADNLYPYGLPGGEPMSEDSEVAPATDKGRLRAAMASEVMVAHQRGDIEAVIGRASDYFGPRGLSSHMGQRVFGPLLAGKKAQLMGDPDRLHTYSYLPDIGRALVTLGASQQAAGQVWHIPSPPTVTTRRFVEAIFEQIGRAPGISVMPSAMLAVLSWFSPMLRAVKAETFQMESDWVMDDTKYRSTFGHGETPLGEAIGATLDWYRSRR